jgi:aminoglycoside/choline kinase family phosphotransferase
MPDLQSAIAYIARSTGEAVSLVRPLSSISNSAALVRVGDRQGALRLHTLSFGPPVTDHARELGIHRFAAANGFAPDIIFADADAGILVTAWQPQGALSAAGLARPGTLAALGARLRSLHALEPPADLGGYGLEEAAVVYAAFARPARRAEAARLVRIVAGNEARQESRRVLCHRDLLHTNILATAPLQFIDWEFASPGERWFDLAGVIEWHSLDARAQRMLTEAYLGRSATSREAAALGRARESFAALSTLWAEKSAGG